jgi:hypothetical protein
MKIKEKIAEIFFDICSHLEIKTDRFYRFKIMLR